MTHHGGRTLTKDEVVAVAATVTPIERVKKVSQTRTFIGAEEQSKCRQSRRRHESVNKLR